MTEYKYPLWVNILTFTRIAGASCPFFGMSMKSLPLGMLAGTLQGVVVNLCRKHKLGLAVERFTGVFFPTLFSLVVLRFFAPDENLTALFLRMYMPIAAGTIIVDGLCRINTRDGVKTFLKSFLICTRQGAGTFCALRIGERLWM